MNHSVTNLLAFTRNLENYSDMYNDIYISEKISRANIGFYLIHLITFIEEDMYSTS